MESTKECDLDSFKSLHDMVEKSIIYWNSRHTKETPLQLSTDLFISNSIPIFLLKVRYDFKRS